MFFETAGIECPLWLPPLVAFCVSLFTSMAGVSGAFLLLPFQLSIMGYTNPSVSATNSLFNLVAIPAGVYRYCREGRMIWALTLAIIVGELPGTVIGAVIRVLYLPNAGDFKMVVGLVLAYIGYQMLRNLIGRAPSNINANTIGNHHLPVFDVRIVHSTLRRLEYTFNGQPYHASPIMIAVIGLFAGIASGICGIGGGSIIAPILVSIFALPVHTVAGAVLMGSFTTSLVGVLSYQALAFRFPDVSVAPDWLLGILFGLGGIVGMYTGACCQKFVPAKAIKWMLCGITIFTAIKYLLARVGW